MASFYSKPADYGTYTQASNLELVNFVMSSKQQKYDYNLAKVESKIKDQLGSIDLERVQDKEYFLNKASDVLASIGDMSKLDWSKNGVSRQVDSQLNTIVDDRVLNDTISTRNYRSFQKTLQEKQSGKNPELYSAQNAAFAMDRYGVNSWLKGDSDSVKSISYEDYVDVGKELNDISLNLPKYARVFERTNVTDGGKYLVDEKGTVLTSSEVKAIAESQLSDKAKRQMQINGWSKYDGGSRSTADITKDFSEFATADIAKAQTQIDDLDMQIRNLGTNDPRIKKLGIQKEQWEKNKATKGSTYKEWIDSGSKSNMTSTMESESVLSNFGNTFSINNITLSNRRADSYVLANYNNKLAMARDAQNLLAASAAATAASLRPPGSGPYQKIDLTLKAGDPGYTEIKPYADKQKELEVSNDKYKATVNEVMQKLRARDEEFAKKVESSAKELMTKEGLTREVAIDAALENALGSGELVTVELLQAMDSARSNRDVVAKELDTTTTEAFKQEEAKAAPTIIKELDLTNRRGQNNAGIKLVDLEGKLTTGGALVNKYGLTEENINNPENAEIRDHIIKNYYAQKILEAGPEVSVLSRIGERMAYANLMSPGTDLGLSAALVKAGEGDTEEIKMMKSRLVKMSGGEAQSAKFLNQARDLEVYDTDTFEEILSYLPSLTDNDPQATALSDDSAINATITFDKVKSSASKLLNQGFGGAKVPAGLVVNPDAPQSKALKAILNSPDAILSGGASGSFDEGSSVTLTDRGGGVIRASLMDVKQGEVEKQYVDLPKKNLPDLIRAEVNFEIENRGFSANNMTEVVGDTKLYDKNNIAQLYGLASVAKKEIGDVMNTATVQGFKRQMSAYSALPEIGSKESPGKARQALTKMVEEGDLKLKIKKVSDRFHNSFVRKDPSTGQEIAVYTFIRPIDPSNYKIAHDYAKYAGQLALNNIISEELILLASGGSIEEAEFINNIITEYGD